MKNVVKYLIIFFICHLSFINCSAQTYKLCGVWFGYPYYNGITTQPLTEIIIITQLGKTVIAIKYTGDTAVTKGSPTFFIPLYNKSSIPSLGVYLISGSAAFPNSGCVGTGIVTIPDSTHIIFPQGAPSFTKANQTQIDSMHINFDSIVSCFDKNNESNGLSGIWFGGPYNCGKTQQNQTEAIIISEIAQNIVASKFTGDSCGPKGSVTFFIPDYKNNNSTAYVITGKPTKFGSNSGCGPVSYLVTDSAHIKVGGYNYTKATAAQIDSLQINVDSLQVCCSLNTGIKKIINDEIFKIFPNPSSNMVTIEIHNNSTTSTITISNVLGDIVAVSQTISLYTEVDVGNLPNGIYFVHLYSKDSSIVKKIVVQH